VAIVCFFVGPEEPLIELLNAKLGHGVGGVGAESLASVCLCVSNVKFIPFQGELKIGQGVSDWSSGVMLMALGQRLSRRMLQKEMVGMGDIMDVWSG